ncbi:MAG TPA: hypothetical protein VKO87_02990 [Gemmatimonadaceae bacterium]|nr:hypothetical protein [Gemmatimonadaceae bacterium]
MTTELTAREVLELLRFRRLDAHNGSIAGNEAAVRFCGQVAELLERLMGGPEPLPPKELITSEHWLFVCSANLVRSPTAEYVARRAGRFASAAGTGRNTFPKGMAVMPLTQFHLKWAHVIVCMEQEHLDVVREHGEDIAGKSVYCWNLPDIGWNPYDADLVQLCEDHFAETLADYQAACRGHGQTS